MAVENYERRKKALEKPLDEFLAPFKEKLQGERIRTFPPPVQEALNTQKTNGLQNRRNWPTTMRRLFALILQSIRRS